MAHITITHTHADGTILTGSNKGDGVWDIVRQRQHGGFTYRKVPGIFIMGSRDKDAQTGRIDTAKAALEAAGHTVTVEIDNQWRTAAEREADRAERVEARVDRFEGYADNAARRSDAAHERSNQLSARFAGGQPILVDHYSAPAAFNAQRKSHDAMRRSIREDAKAEHYANRAEGAARAEAHKQNPRAIMRRIERLKADRRRYERDRDVEGRTELSRGRYQDEIDRLTEDIDYQRAKLAEMAASGSFKAWTPEDFAKGDEANVGGHWLLVHRVNKKSLTVSWWGNRPGGRVITETARYDKVHGRRRDGMQWDTPLGEPWPVADAKQVRRWRTLAHAATLRSNEYTEETRHVGWAQRIAHGLPLTASPREVAAFHPDKGDIEAWRALRIAYLGVYERLAAKEPMADIRSSTTPIGEAGWRVPGTDPEDRRAKEIQPGDLVVGVCTYDRGHRKVIRQFTGPVAKVSDGRYDSTYARTWYTVTLTDGTDAEFTDSQWFAVHPAGTW